MNTRPYEGVRMRVHEYTQAFIKGPREKGFSALLQIESDSASEKADLDHLIRHLLKVIKASDIKEIESYD